LLLETGNRPSALQKRSTMSAQPLFWKINCAMRLAVLDS
jgi:hypothetical protein